MRIVWTSALAIEFLMLGSVIVFAQPSTVREVTSHIEGTVFLDGQRLESSASHFPLKENSVVRTENGRRRVARWREHRILGFQKLLPSVGCVTP
jgi:hypothetical protein